MSLIGTLLNSSIYITLDTRPNPGEYHWRLLLIDDKGKPVLHHATNRDGPWTYETRPGHPAQLLTLITVIRVSGVRDYHEATRVLQRSRADGTPSRRTGVSFNCRIWVKDALVELHEDGIIALPSDIDTIEVKAVKHGLEYAFLSEGGGGATVINEPF